MKKLPADRREKIKGMRMLKISKLGAMLAFAVSANSYAQMQPCNGSLASIQADKDHDGILFIDQPGKRGTAWCNYSEDGVLDKPIIVAEGFDFESAVTGDPNDNVTGLGMWALLNEHDQAESLRELGYDFIVLDYNEPLAAIQANAMVYSKLVQTVNEEKVGIYKNIAMGMSMGGLVAKTGLAFMEYDGVNHDASLYVSLDSPHGCAQVNLDLQNVAQAASGQDIPAGQRLWEDVLRSDAALQMLCSTAHDWNDDLLTDLMGYGRKRKIRSAYNTHRLKFSVSGNGFPTLTRNIAFANGSGEKQAADPGDLLVSFGGGLNFLDINAAGQEFPADTMPGSTAPWFDLLSGSLDVSDLDMTITQGKDTITFIPTMSAIGLGPRDVYDYGERTDSFWNLYESALVAVEYPSEEEREAGSAGLTTEELLDYYSTFSLMLFGIFQEDPTVYLDNAISQGVVDTYETCYEKQVEGEEGTVTECYDTPVYDLDLTLVDSLASHTPFDEVYLNFTNDEHANVPLDHGENLVQEVLENTQIKFELILPALMLII